MKILSFATGSSTSGKLLFEPLEHAAKTVVLDQKQQLFFRFAVVIQTGEADIRRTRDVAHRGRVITLLGKDARRRAEDEFEFLIVTRSSLQDQLNTDQNRLRRSLTSCSCLIFITVHIQTQTVFP